MNKELVLVIDFGGQYNQLVARRIRECNVYCEIYSYKTEIYKIKAMKPKGIILTGGPSSCYEAGAAACSPELFELGIPVLGLCYGAQLMSHMLGGEVARATVREYGKTEVDIDETSRLFQGVTPHTVCWMSHFDYIARMAGGLRPRPIVPWRRQRMKRESCMPSSSIRRFSTPWKASRCCTILCAVFAAAAATGGWILSWRRASAPSAGGSARGRFSAPCPAAWTLRWRRSRAVGEQLTCVFVDHGLLRKNEGDEVERIFGPEGNYDLNFVRVNAQERFYARLAGVTEPEEKRKIIGGEFIRVFEEEARKIGAVDFLVQGTIYPDVVESGLGGESAVIKSHHNVGGLPACVDFREIVEPLRNLFKDEVRKVGLELGIPEQLVFRQPFPGPGLGIRIIGEVTAQKVRMVQDADAIYREEIAKAGLDRKINQYFAALTNMRSVGVMGDERTYEYAVALRAMETVDFMTAESAQIPYEVLQKVSSRIINEVSHVNRVLYDITSKPPGTIEIE